MRVRQAPPDFARGLDVIHRVVVVLLDAGRDREDVRVEDDVLRRETRLLGEDLVRARADLDLALPRVGLAFFIEGHHHHGRAVAAAGARLFDEFFLAFLEADGVHHRLALHAFQAGLDHTPLGGVDHDRHARDFRFGGDQVQEGRHGLLALEHGLVHVHVDHLRAVLHLLARHVEGLVVFVIEDEFFERGRAGDVGALAHVHEQAVGADVERLQPREPALRFDLRQRARADATHGLGDGLDMRWRGAAAAANDIKETGLGPFPDLPGHEFGRVVVTAEFIGQTGVGVAADVHVRDARHFLDVLTQLFGAERTVQTHAQGLGVGDGIPEGLGGLAGKRAPAGVGNRARDHDRHADAVPVKIPVNRAQRRLAVERVEYRFHQ